MVTTGYIWLQRICNQKEENINQKLNKLYMVTKLHKNEYAVNYKERLFNYIYKEAIYKKGRCVSYSV